MFERSVSLILQSLAAAQTQTGAPPAQPQGLDMRSMWLFFIAMAAIMYFLMIRPNQKREKERKDMLASLSKGDKVVTTGGICGTIVGLTDKSVVLRVSDEPVVKIEFLRGAISRVAAREGKDD